MVEIKILIVEDSVFIAKAIKHLAESEGYKADFTSEGAKVVDLVKKNNYNLVILDLMMPGVSGKEVFTMLKEDDDTKHVPILILTARIDALKWDKELRACDKYMRKPFDNDELLSVIKELV